MYLPKTRAKRVNLRARGYESAQYVDVMFSLTNTLTQCENAIIITRIIYSQVRIVRVLDVPTLRSAMIKHGEIEAPPELPIYPLAVLSHSRHFGTLGITSIGIVAKTCQIREDRSHRPVLSASYLIVCDLLELHFLGAEVDLVRVVFNESLEYLYEVLVLVKKRRNLQIRADWSRMVFVGYTRQHERCGRHISRHICMFTCLHRTAAILVPRQETQFD